MFAFNASNYFSAARDYGNPSPNDPHYTVTRHMDWFAGHSWASGIAGNAGPRNQESSSEAINGYYSLLLFAKAINNAQLVDYARMLLAIEIAGTQTYWHLYPASTDPDTPYPEQGFRDLTTVGNVFDWEHGAYLLGNWGTGRRHLVGIQTLPVTPIGQYFYDQNWMTGVFPYCKAELDDPTIDGAFKSGMVAVPGKVWVKKAVKPHPWWRSIFLADCLRQEFLFSLSFTQLHA